MATSAYSSADFDNDNEDFEEDLGRGQQEIRRTQGMVNHGELLSVSFSTLS